MHAHKRHLYEIDIFTLGIAKMPVFKLHFMKISGKIISKYSIRPAIREESEFFQELYRFLYRFLPKNSSHQHLIKNTGFHEILHNLIKARNYFTSIYLFLFTLHLWQQTYALHVADQ